MLTVEWTALFSYAWVADPGNGSHTCEVQKKIGERLSCLPRRSEREEKKKKERKFCSILCLLSFKILSITTTTATTRKVKARWSCTMASGTIQPALDTLPMELLYRLLDLLDAETILSSIGHVCRRFRQVTHTYRQYQLNFQSITQRSFRLMCLRIEPEHVVSLTLSDDNRTPEQIASFLSRFQLQQFTHLRSLTLIHVDEIHFQTILKTCPTISSLSWSLPDNSLEDSNTMPLINAIIARPSLQHLSFSLHWNHMENVLFPNPCFLKSLTIGNRLDFPQFSTILARSPHLKTFVLQDCLVDDVIDLSTQPVSYPQLTSLVLDDCTMDMSHCEWILPLTPSLEHLLLVGGTNLNDGLRWEQLIRTQLKRLRKFEFAFSGETHLLPDDAVNVDPLIVSFRTAFWLEIKQWFVVYYYFKDSSTYSLYSLPICRCNVRFYPKRDKIFSSTYPKIHRDVIMTDRIHEMQLNLTSLVTARNDSEEVRPSFHVRKDDHSRGNCFILLIFICRTRCQFILIFAECTNYRSVLKMNGRSVLLIFFNRLSICLHWQNYRSMLISILKRMTIKSLIWPIYSNKHTISVRWRSAVHHPAWKQFAC